jgi:diguanylate cyclase (GGDEF)-like protein/PAS domain S-box-containing protein
MTRTRRSPLTLPWAFVAGSAAVLAAVWVLAPRHPFEQLAAFLPLHAFLEVLSIVVAGLVFGVVWNSFNRERPGRTVLLACALLAVALIDFAHALSYPGMPAFVTPSGTEKSIFFWLAARFVAAAGLLSFALLSSRRLRSRGTRYAFLAAAMGISLLVYWIGLFQAEILPRTFVDDIGLTPAKIGAETAVMAILAAAAALLYRRARSDGSRTDALLFAAAALSVLSEFCFSRYTTVTDVFSLLGHLLKVAAYGFVYHAVFVDSVRKPFEAALDRERKLVRAERIAQVGSWEVDLPANRLGYSKEALRIHGLSPGAFDGTLTGAIDLAHPEDRSRLSTAINETIYEGKPFSIDYRIVLPDGGVRFVHAEDEVVRDRAGRPLRAFGITQDITERKEAEAKIARLNRLYAVLSGINSSIVRVQNSAELYGEACRILVESGQLALAYICVVDPVNDRLQLAASAGLDASRFLTGVQARMSLRDGAPDGYGPPAQAVRDRQPVVINDIASDPQIRRKLEQLGSGIRSVAALPLIVSGAPVAVLALHAADTGFFDEQQMRLFTELAGDIAFALDHIGKADKLDYLAYYDQLTGLANRRLFLERLTQTLHFAGQAGDKVALLLVDLERLATVNESLGRQAGDALVTQLSERLTRSAGAGELARVSANHFAVLFRAVKGKSEVMRRTDRLWQECFAEPFRIGNSDQRSSARGGIALFPGAADAEALLQNAEAALRRAKQTGERHVFHALEMTAKSSERLSLENRLRQGLDRQEFLLHYQPKVNLETGRIVGVEALMRWQSPELGLVQPLKFISLMEETGMILEAGAWALSRAVEDHQRWGKLGLRAPRVAVNVSAVQLRKKDYMTALKEALSRGAAPTGIDLEITESVVMEDIQGNIEKLIEARNLGVSIAIDDFGTGYSSLGYLARLPVQSLKIDRSFIIAMLSDRGTMTLVQTIISLARSLRLKVIAEGVETEEQARTLRLLRCDEMQGYLFSEPLPFEQMTEFLAKHQVKRAPSRAA